MHFSYFESQLMRTSLVLCRLCGLMRHWARGGRAWKVRFVGYVNEWVLASVVFQRWELEVWSGVHF